MEKVWKDAVERVISKGDIVIYYTTQGSSISKHFAVVVDMTETSLKVRSMSIYSSSGLNNKLTALRRPNIVIIKQEELYQMNPDKAKELIEFSKEIKG